MATFPRLHFCDLISPSRLQSRTFTQGLLHPHLKLPSLWFSAFPTVRSGSSPGMSSLNNLSLEPIFTPSVYPQTGQKHELNPISKSSGRCPLTQVLTPLSHLRKEQGSLHPCHHTVTAAHKSRSLFPALVPKTDTGHQVLKSSHTLTLLSSGSALALLPHSTKSEVQ